MADHVIIGALRDTKGLVAVSISAGAMKVAADMLAKCGADEPVTITVPVQLVRARTGAKS